MHGTTPAKLTDQSFPNNYTLVEDKRINKQASAATYFNANRNIEAVTEWRRRSIIRKALSICNPFNEGVSSNGEEVTEGSLG